MKSIVLLLALAACSGQPKPPTTTGGGGSGSATAPIAEAADRDDCTTDEDCTLADACCGCNSGGRRVALRADALTAYNQGREARCGGQMCAMHISNHPSCNAEAVCKKGHCRVQPHMNQSSDPVIPPAEPTKP